MFPGRKLISTLLATATIDCTAESEPPPDSSASLEVEANPGFDVSDSVSTIDAEALPDAEAPREDEGLLDAEAASDADTSVMETADVDASPPYDPEECHFDCWPYAECLDGTVVSAGGGFWSGPCESSPTSCPSAHTYPCERGCGLLTRCEPAMDEVCGDAPCDLASFCAEARPGRVGDPCESDTDCRWTCAPADAAIGKLYQRCDVANHVCVTIEPPPSTLFQIDCNLDHEAALAETTPTSPSAVVEAAACPSGVCVLARGSSADGVDCVNQACTVPCDGDDVCPDGTWCVAPLGVCAPLELSSWPGVCH